MALDPDDHSWCIVLSRSSSNDSDLTMDSHDPPSASAILRNSPNHKTVSQYGLPSPSPQLQSSRDESTALGQNNRLGLHQPTPTFENRNTVSFQRTAQAYASSDVTATMGSLRLDPKVQQQTGATSPPGYIDHCTNDSRAVGKFQSLFLETNKGGQLPWSCDACLLKKKECDGGYPCSGCCESFLQSKSATCSYDHVSGQALQNAGIEQATDMLLPPPMKSEIQKQSNSTPTYSSPINDPLGKVETRPGLSAAQDYPHPTTPYPFNASNPTYNIGEAQNTLPNTLPMSALQMPSGLSMPQPELPLHLRDGIPRRYNIVVKSPKIGICISKSGTWFSLEEANAELRNNFTRMRAHDLCISGQIWSKDGLELGYLQYPDGHSIALQICWMGPASARWECVGLRGVELVQLTRPPANY